MGRVRAGRGSNLAVVMPVDDATRAGSVWCLYGGGELLAELEVTGPDQPWLEGRVTPRPAFEEVRPLFDEELAVLTQMDGRDDGVEAWEATYRRVVEVVELAKPDGRRVAEFLLHVDGDRAWWRWSDEPFED